MQQIFSRIPTPYFAVEHLVRGTTRIVTVRGEVDIAAERALDSAIERAIGALPDRVVVDLSATTFMDTTGVHCLLRASRHAGARAVDLVVIPGSSPARRVLGLCRADAELRLTA
jgi:anti-sigma B factor antagonist